MSNQWYLSRNGEQYGPYTWENLIQMSREGNVSSDDMLWNEISQQWVQAQEIPDLFSPAYPAPSAPSAPLPQAKNKSTILIAVILACILVIGSFAWIFHTTQQRPRFAGGIGRGRPVATKLPKVAGYFPPVGPVGSSVYVHFDAPLEEYEDKLTAWYGNEQIAMRSITEDIVQVILPQNAESGEVVIKSDQFSSEKIPFAVEKMNTIPLLTQTVQPSQTMQTVQYKDEINIDFPPDFLDEPAVLSISKVEHAPGHMMEPFGSAISYDISIDGMEELPEFIQVTMKYKPENIDPDHPVQDQFTMMRWDEDNLSWEALPYKVNEAEQTVQFITDHLTLFQGFFAWPSKMAMIKTAGFTLGAVGAVAGAAYIAEKLCFTSYTTPQGHFKLYYNKRVWDVHEQFNTWQKPAMASSLSSYDPKHPDYIQDIGAIFEHAFSNYIKQNFKNPVITPGRVWGEWRTPITVKISGVWSTATGLVAGEEDPQYGKVFKAIHLPARMLMNISSNPDHAYAGIGHELFHRFQAEYYGRRSFLKGFGSTGDYWWIESSAEYAGLMEAWGERKLVHLLENDIRPDIFDYSITSTALVSSQWARDYEYASGTFIHYLVAQEGLSFKNIFEAVASGRNPLARLKTYVDSTQQWKSLEVIYHEYARKSIFSDKGLLKSFLLADFQSDQTNRNNEIAEKKEILNNEEKLPIRVKLESGTAWLEIFVLEGGKRIPGDDFFYSYILTDEEIIPPQRIKKGSALYIQATNTRNQNESVTISVAIDEEDGLELTHTFQLNSNYSSKVWALKIEEGASLAIAPENVPDGKADEEYAFKLRAEDIPFNIKNIDFTWDFGDGTDESTGERKGVQVRQGVAEIEISHTYAAGHQQCTITASITDSASGKELAEAEAYIAFGIKVNIIGGDVEYEMQKDETEYTHTFEAIADPPGRYTYVWSFGDGGSHQETKDQGQNSTATHIFKDGFYTTEVQLKDPDTGDLLANHSVMVTIYQDLQMYDLDECEKWSAAQSGGHGTTINLWDISKLPDGASFDIEFDAFSVPDRFVMQYKGVTVLDTGWRGEASYYNRNPHFYPGGIAGTGRGNVNGIFTKSAETNIRVIVYGPESGTAWNYRVRARCTP